MNREQYIKTLISEKGYTIKSFSSFIKMPYNTLLSMLNNSIGGAAIDNVMKICRGLDITISDLQNYCDENTQCSTISLTEHEKAVVIAYRNKPDMQSAVDTLLNVKINTESEIASDMASVIEKGERLSMKAPTNTK